MSDDKEIFLKTPIYGPSRDQVLEDGVLIHVLNATYKYHTAVTAEVLEKVGEERIREFLVASVTQQIKSWETGGVFEFEGNLYKVECGPGDEAEPVITVMMAWQD